MAAIKEPDYRPPTYLESFHGDRAPRVYYNRLGKTDLMVSNVGLGGATFGNVYHDMEQDVISRIVRETLGAGINFIDTAPWYGQGLSEGRIGVALKDIPRSTYYIGTKIGRYEPTAEKMFDYTYDRTLESIEKSLKLVGVDYFDLVHIHDAESVTNVDQLVEHTFPALLHLKRGGKVKNIGISGYNLQALKTIVENAPLGALDVVMTYSRYTLMNQDALLHTSFFKSEGLGILNASVTSMSLLSGLTDFPKWHPALPWTKKACTDAAKFAKTNNINLGMLSIEWALCTHEFDMTLVSVGNDSQLEENLATFERVKQRAHEGMLSEKPDVHEELQKIMRNITCTHWENIEAAKYWEKMTGDGFEAVFD